MRIPVLLTCLVAAVLAATPMRPAHAEDAAPGGEVTFDLFYNNLSDDGEWYNTPEYGYVWQPDIAYNNDKWRPYSDGYWAQTDSGWTWVAYENFGWATYHYGRWTRLKDIGWAWVPGYEWGPGWVSWRTNDDYVGWAPLPPKAERGVYEGRVADDNRPVRRAEAVDYNDVEAEDTGYTSNVDADYDIGPENYCFVRTQTFGAPVLSEVLLPPQGNFLICEDTRNVTNIYYDRRGRDDVFVYNSGPDFNFLSAHSERPIQRLQIEQRRDPGFLAQGLRAGGNPTQVRGGILQVAAPFIARQPMNFAQIKPVRVKQDIAQPQVVHGWSNTGADPQKVEQLRSHFKQQAEQAPAKAVQPKEQLVQSLPPQQRVITKSDLPVGPAKDMSTDAVAARRAQRQQQRAAQGGTPAAGQALQGRQQPVGQPNAGGPRPAAVTDADRTARRDAAVKERESRDQARQNGGQPAGGQPGQAAPNNGQTAVPNAKDKSPEAVAARREQRQQQRTNGGNSEQATPNGQQPAQAVQPNEKAAQPKDNSDEARAARRAQRQQEKAAQQGNNGGQPAAAKPNEQAAPQGDPDREARRAQRQQEKAAQPQQGEPPAAKAAPQGDAEREARRAQRQQEKAAQAPQAQPQQAQGGGDAEKEARRAQRQQERAAQPQQAQPQQGGGDADREARRAQRQQERAAQPQQEQPRQAQPRQEQPKQEQPKQEQGRGDKGDKGDKGKQGDKPNQ